MPTAAELNSLVRPPSPRWNETVPSVCSSTPFVLSETAFMATPPPAEGLMLAVTTLPFSPKLTPFRLLNVIALRLLEVVPADTLMLVRLVAMEAVTVEPLSPKLTPLLFEYTIFDRFPEVVPALKLMLAAARTVPPPAAVEIAQPTLFVFVNTRLLSATELPPALTVISPWVLATVTEAVSVEPAIPKVTLFAFE